MGGMSTRNEIKARLGILAIPNATLGGSKRRFAAEATPQQVKAMLSQAFDFAGTLHDRRGDMERLIEDSRVYDLDAYDQAWELGKTISRAIQAWAAPVLESERLLGQGQVDRALALLTSAMGKKNAVSTQISGFERKLNQIVSQAKRKHDQRKRGRA